MDQRTVATVRYRPSDIYDRCPVCVRQDPKLDVKAIFCYMVISSMARSTNHCWASNARLAEECRMSVSSVSSALKTLEERGLLTITYEGPGNSTRNIIVERVDEIYDGPSQILDPTLPESETPLSKSETPPLKIWDPPSQNLGPEHDKRTRIENTTEEHTSASPAETPYSMWEVFAEATGQDLSLATKREKGMSLKVAKELIEDGVQAWEVKACARFLNSQSWRKDPLSMQTIAREIGKWRMQGRPVREQGKKSGVLAFLDEESPKTETPPAFVPDDGIIEADWRTT